MDIPELFVAAGAIPTITPEQHRRARLSVAHHATDADECAELLAMIGLDKPATAPEIAADGSGVPEYRGDGVGAHRTRVGRRTRATRAGTGRSSR